jgi:hypothetical protein
VGKPEEKRQVGRPKHRWVVILRMMNVRKIGWNGKNWIYLAHDRRRWRVLVNTVINLRVPQNIWTFFVM